MKPSRTIATARALVRQLMTSSTVAESSKRVGLFKRISALGVTGGSVTEMLNDYVMEAKQIPKNKLDICIRQLRKYGRYEHARQIMEWMEKREFSFSFSDLAIYLDLLSKTKGIAAAEKYFNGLDKPSKNIFTYGSLFNCYCKAVIEDKALTLLKEMEELHFANSLAYNNLMALYMKMDKHEKVPLVVEKMEQKNISKDSFSYVMLMQSYSKLNDIEGVERVWKEMHEKEAYLCDWVTYSNLATVYVKAQLFEKAESALKKMEEVMDRQNRRQYHFLISLYAGINNFSEVNRVWCSLKAAFPKTTNLSYLCMLQALRKLRDIEGLLKCYEEWASSCSTYDLRLVKVAMSGCLKEGMLEKATTLFDNAVKRAYGPFFKGRELFMVFFLKRNKVDLAIEHLQEAVSEAKGGKWLPGKGTFDAFVQHFEHEKDIDSVERCFNILKEADGLKPIAYSLLIKGYNAAAKTKPELRKMLEEDEIKIKLELKHLLNKVCPL